MGSPFYWPTAPPPRDYVSLDDPLEYLRRAVAAEDSGIVPSAVSDPQPPPISTNGVPDEWDLSLPFGLEKKIPPLQDLAAILFAHEADKGTSTKTPEGTAGAGSGGQSPARSSVVPESPVPPSAVGSDWWNNGKDNASHAPVVDPGPVPVSHLGFGLDRYGKQGGPAVWDVAAHEGMDAGQPTQYGTISASMNTWTPGDEDLTGLKRHAVNAADFQVPNPVPPPPVPTTVTSARFDQKEGFVPLGPPTGTTGVRESYQGVPTDPEEERQRRMEREAQNLQLEEMRQKVRDPYGKERFDAEQRRGDLVKKAEIDRMTEEERRKSFATVMKQLDDEAAARIEAASRKPPSKERDAMIEAIRQRVESAKEAQRQAFGIGARLSSSELYKTNPY